MFALIQRWLEWLQRMLGGSTADAWVEPSSDLTRAILDEASWAGLPEGPLYPPALALSTSEAAPTAASSEAAEESPARRRGRAA